MARRSFDGIVKAVLPENGEPIMFVGERPGPDEEFWGVPQIGSSAFSVFYPLLEVAGLSKDRVGITNVFSRRPPDDALGAWLVPKDEVGDVPAGFEDWAKAALEPGGYLPGAMFGELERLRSEIEQYKPNLVVTLGGVALWAMCCQATVGKARGAVLPSLLVPGVKVIPTYNPAYVARSWEKAFIPALFDFIKAVGEMGDKEIRRPVREVWVDPSVADLQVFKQRYLDPAPIISFDVETTSRFDGVLKCLGFSGDTEHALVVPFYDATAQDYTYWRTAAHERQARDFCASVLEGPQPKLGHNGLYDVQWVWRKLGIRVRNYLHDTMLLHHAKYLELPKDLGTLGSIYTNEGAWKNMTRNEKFAREK